MKLTPAQKRIREFKKFEKQIIKQQERLNKARTVESRKLEKIEDKLDDMTNQYAKLRDQLIAERGRLIATLSPTEFDKHLDEL